MSFDELLSIGNSVNQSMDLTAERFADVQEREDKSNIWSQVAGNIKKSEQLRGQINKALHDGQPANQVLAMALECIGLMTGDMVFYRQNIERLRNECNKR